MRDTNMFTCRTSVWRRYMHVQYSYTENCLKGQQVDNKLPALYHNHARILGDREIKTCVNDSDT